MARRTAFVALALFTAALVAAGCTSRYAVDTTLRADGTVERTVDQPASSFPDSARTAAGWTVPPPRAKVPPPGTKPVAIAGRSDVDGTRVTATGRFPSVAAVPDHLVVEAGRPTPKDEPAASRLVRQVDATDHVFLTSHTYRETLTDVVTPDGCRRARAELIAVGRDVLTAVAEELDDGAYDATGLAAWLGADGKAWIDELVEAAALIAADDRPRARFGDSDWDALAAAAVRLSVPHALDLTDGHGGTVEKDEAGRRTRALVVDLLRRTVRWRKAGRPIDAATAGRLVDRIDEAARLSDAEAGDADNAEARRTRAALERAAAKVAARRGGAEANSGRLAWLVAQVAGTYGLDLRTHQFEFTLRVPGTVVRADGELLADDRVRWRFQGRDAWPAGYDMTCRYLQPDEALQRKVLGGVPLRGRAEMVEYVELLDATDAKPADGIAGALRAVTPRQVARPEPDNVPAVARLPLRGVLQACVKAGSAAPLRTHAAGLARAGPPAKAALDRCRRMMELLGVKA